MSQDSEKNDREAGQSRDGDRRSFGRRDDARTSGPTGPRTNRDGDRPRFSRDNDRPKFNRPADGDRPRFSRDGRTGGPGGAAPRGGDSRDSGAPNRPFRPAGAGPRDTTNRAGGPTGKPRFERDQKDRPSFNRDGDRPRFSRDNDRPKFNRPADGDRPRFSRDDRPSGPGSSTSRDSTSRPSGPPRTSRDNRSERPDQRRRDTDSPRFTNDRNRSADRPGSDRPKREDRPNEERPRFTRSEVMRGSNRNNDSRNSGASRFPGDRKRTGGSARPDKPAFKRVGGFDRAADERNNGRSSGSDDRRSDVESRFTGQQRKESGNRRTGDFTKAPDYNLEQTRANDSFKRGRSDDQRSDAEKGKRSSDNDRTDGPRTDGQRNAGPETTRLNRYIANSGVCSRREADELIARGDISVNGKVVIEMGYKVKEGDTVKYGTKALSPERFVYVLLNKPKDYITTTEDPNERKTVMELVADAGNFRMYPVGRLDRNTTGLLLLTNDGELADKLTHPSNNIRKIYQVELDKPITDEHFEAIKKGIELEDGPIKPDAISIVTPDAYVIGVEIHSGRNRIVRRIFENFGYEVSKLDRTTYAGLTKKELPRGKWRFLDPKEVVKLKYLNS
ncbi:pseudouridine synthase [Spirosoma flavum]|uniref:Pseudouridine synthase n=1 Tax=Spirosoma flavum TaxID=2048557 RepID=A0ABW6AP01_9BACT